MLLGTPTNEIGLQILQHLGSLAANFFLDLVVQTILANLQFSQLLLLGTKSILHLSYLLSTSLRHCCLARDQAAPILILTCYVSTKKKEQRRERERAWGDKRRSLRENRSISVIAELIWRITVAYYIGSTPSANPLFPPNKLPQRTLNLRYRTTTWPETLQKTLILVTL